MQDAEYDGSQQDVIIGAVDLEKRLAQSAQIAKRVAVEGQIPELALGHICGLHDVAQ